MQWNWNLLKVSNSKFRIKCFKIILYLSHFRKSRSAFVALYHVITYRVASSATDGRGEGIDRQAAMFGSDGRTCRRGQSRPDGTRARTCVNQVRKIEKGVRWQPLNSVHRCGKDPGKDGWAEGIFPCEPTKRRRRRDATSGDRRRGSREKRREREAARKKGEGEEGRDRHRGVRARVLAQSISQPVANVAWFLGTFSPRGAIGLSECRIVFARAECPSLLSLFTTAPSVGSATLSRAGARALTNRRAGVRDDWRRVKEVCWTSVHFWNL